MKNRFEYILFVFLSSIFRILGLNLSRRVSVLIAFLFFYFIPIRKKTTIENLSHAFPSYSEDEIKKLAFKCYRSFCITLSEILVMPFLSEQEIKNAVYCSNTNLILEKHKEGKGVVLLSAHYGNWEYIAASFGLQINTSLSVVVKSQRNPFVTDWLNKTRTMWTNKAVLLGVSIRQIFKELKEKNIVAMVADQRGPSDGIRVKFFGRPVSVYPGPAMLALKTGAPILYGIAVRQKDYSYKAIMHEISLEDLTGSNEEKIVEISQRHTSYLEQIIREHPEQWLWMHKRWKY
ncbi:MAG: lysophospholipid acyltransferase family protein [Ignavibacteriaceae bacterium]